MKMFTVQEKSLGLQAMGPDSFVPVNFATQMGMQESKNRQERSGMDIGIVLGSLANISTVQTADMQKSTNGQQNIERNPEPATTCTKRTATSQPSAVKRFKDATVIVTPITTVATSAAKHFTTTPIPVTTMPSVSAPPLSCIIQPPSISMDKLSASLLGQPKWKSQDHSTIPQGFPTDIHSWTIDQVVKYFQFTPDCRDYADIFHEQEVDGTALLLLTHESLVKCLGIKLGKALKIMMHVEDLRKQCDAKNQ